MPTSLTPDQFLAGFPPPIQALAQRLRVLIRRGLPESTEQVRLGWQLIGFYVPARGRKPVYTGFIIPHSDYVTLGFEYGILLDDPDGVLLGGAEQLRQVRYLTFRSAGDLRAEVVRPYLQQAAELALMPNALRRQLLAAAQEAQGAKRPRRSAR